MIVRTSADHLLLITQPDHAVLAAAIAAACERERIDPSRRDLVLLAAREHDNGWREEDAAPLVDPATGRVVDFIAAPAAVRQRVWPRGVERLADTPYAAALVAHHAVTVYDRYRGEPEWQPFFDSMIQMRDRLLRAASNMPLQVLQQDYRFVRLGDLVSLVFCNGWLEEQRFEEYSLQLDGPRLTIRPDPFDRREILLSITARQLPNHHYRSPAEAAAAWNAAPVVTVTGVALGAP